MYAAFMASLALSELLGAPVMDASGAVSGRVREVALSPQEDPSRIAALIVRTRDGDRVLVRDEIRSLDGRSLRASGQASAWPEFAGKNAEGFLFLERDLLDQQIIDVNG